MRQIAVSAFIGAVLLFGLVYQSYQIDTLERRLDLLESQPAGSAPVAHGRTPGARPEATPMVRRHGAGGPPPMGFRGNRGEAGDAAVAALGDDPALEAQVAEIVEQVQERSWQERREQWAARWRENMLDEIDRYAADNHIDAGTADAVGRLLDDHYEEQRLRWEAVRKDQISMTDARSEGETAESALEVEVVRLIGSDGWTSIEENVLHRRGGH